jgi:uncharacterized protein (TIGR02246 family)
MNFDGQPGRYLCQSKFNMRMKGKTMKNDATDEVMTVIHAVYDAWAAGDAEAFAELYTDDATVVQPGTHKKDKGEIRTMMAAGFAGPLKGSRVLDEPQSVRFLGAGAAVVVSEGGVIMAGHDDVPAERMVRATWALTKQDGQWLVAAYQNSPAN